MPVVAGCMAGPTEQDSYLSTCKGSVIPCSSLTDHGRSRAVPGSGQAALAAICNSHPRQHPPPPRPQSVCSMSQHKFPGTSWAAHTCTSRSQCYRWHLAEQLRALQDSQLSIVVQLLGMSNLVCMPHV